MSEIEQLQWDLLIDAMENKIIEIQSSPTGTDMPLVTVSNEELAQTIDHTLLKPDATHAQIDQLCDEAIQYKFKTCCVNGTNIKQVAKRLHGSSSIPCSVIGFPLGAGTSRSKAFETAHAIEEGAREIDMVINIGSLKSRNYKHVYDDIKAVVEVSDGNIVKVILETALLSDEEKIAGAFLSAEAGAAFVKTCTGFSGGVAAVHDVRLLRKAVAHKIAVKVKASAGIRSYDQCLEMLRAGADRIGTSSGVAIIEKAVSHAGVY